MECDTETGTFKKHSDNLADLTNCHFRLKEGNFQQKQNIFHYTVFLEGAVQKNVQKMGKGPHIFLPPPPTGPKLGNNNT